MRSNRCGVLDVGELSTRLVCEGRIEVELATACRPCDGMITGGASPMVLWQVQIYAQQSGQTKELVSGRGSVNLITGSGTERDGHRNPTYWRRLERARRLPVA